MTLIPVILCGSSGTRLWPLSRRDTRNDRHGVVLDQDAFAWCESISFDHDVVEQEKSLAVVLFAAR